MALCAQQDVIDRLGGAEVAAQLLDPNRTGTYDTSILDGAIGDAEGDVEAAYGARFKQIASGVSVPPKVRRLTAELAVMYCWRRGPKNLAMPEAVGEMLRDNRRELERIEASQTSPGGDPVSRFPTHIDNSQRGRRAVFSSWRRGGINGGR